MATAATRLLTVEEFLEIEFDLDGDTPRVELDNGVVWAMAGGSAAHSRVQGNIFAILFEQLRGTGCRPHGPDMGVRTHDLSLRYPDASVFCGREGAENDKMKQFDDPKFVAEVLSPTTRRKDEDVKLPEYRAVHSLDTILYVDPEKETVRLSFRTETGGWRDVEVERGDDISIKSLSVTLRWSDIFARD